MFIVKLRRLQILELLDVRPDLGTIHIKGQRMVLQSVSALGLLREEMIEAFGIDAVRRLAYRNGFATGYQAGKTLTRHFGSTNALEDIEVGCTLHTLGLGVLVEPINSVLEPDGRFHCDTICRNSYEAEQYLQHFPVGNFPVCWSMSGYASGFCSAVVGREVYAQETMCVGRGDPYCYLVTRDEKAWGEEFQAIRAEFSPIIAESSQQGPRSLAEEVERLRKLSKIQFEHLIEYAEKLTGVSVTHTSLRTRAVEAAKAKHFIASTPAMLDSLALALRVAPLDMPVVVQGESGTGKEFLVHLIHQQGPRAKEPFVALNCAALSESLLESELFGHVRGAFTGAIRDKKGLLELAGNGTIFLDEIGEMPLALQPKLLRAFENREIRPVGSEHIVRIGARIVTATNRNLVDAVAEGRFRNDLYYRLVAFAIHLPPLREHLDDIPLLVQEFIEQSNVRFGTNVRGVSSEVMSFLLHHPWPGNVRQLKHAIEHAVVVASEAVIRIGDLPKELSTGFKEPSLIPLPLNDGIERQERKLIEEALKRHNWKRAEVAKELNISSVTLWRKVRQYGLVDPFLCLTVAALALGSTM